MLKNFVSPYSATAVDRLLANKCSTIGKTNMDEFAMGSGTLYSPYGPAVNPWSKIGGSSGGSASSVSLGLAAVAIGSDTGGSIRQPAAFCGIAGYKPSYGIVSRYGLVSMTSSMDTVGVLGRCVMDCALIADIMRGPDGVDSTCYEESLSDDRLFLTKSSLGQTLTNSPTPEEVLECIEEFSRRVETQKCLLNGVVIGVPNECHIKELSPDIVNTWKSCIRDLQSVGAEVVPVSIPSLKYSLPSYYVIACAESSSNLSRYDGLRFGLWLNQADTITSLWGRGDESVHEELMQDLRNSILELIKSSSSSSQSMLNNNNDHHNQDIIDSILNSAKDTATSRGAIHSFMSLVRTLGFGEEVQRRILCGCYVLSRDKCKEFYEAAWKVRSRLSTELNKVFQSVDVVLMPTTPSLPFLISSPPSPQEMPAHDVLTVLANLTGCPAVSVACDVVSSGSNKDRLPIGMQIMGNVRQDHKVLRIGAVLEELRRCRIEGDLPKEA